jgi:hypothetical protein
LGWNELVATSALVQDEVIQAILGMNQKDILFPCLGIFHPPLCSKIVPSFLLPPSYLPLPTSLTSFPIHSISRAWESSWAWVAQSFEETWDTRLEEGGVLNIEGMSRGESKRNVSSQIQKRKKKVKLLPFSTFFFLLYEFFFLLLEKKKMKRRRCLK